EAIDSLIEQFHFDNFLPASHEIAVFIENGGGDGKIVAIASIDLAEANTLEIHMHEHGEAGLGGILLEKLSLKIDGQVVDFVLREERFLDFFLCGLRGIGNGARGKISTAGL